MKKNRTLATWLNYFFQGLLFVLPIFISAYIIIKLVTFVDEIFRLGIPGSGIFITIVGTAVIGYFVKNFVTGPAFSYFDRLLTRTPLVKIIYTSIRDLLEAFVGEQKKFNQPVLAETHEGVFRIGFLTQEDLSNLETKMVAVYCPHSYNFSGDLYLVDRKKVKPLKGNAADIMKFVVSGGVTSLEEIEKQRAEESLPVPNQKA